MNNNNHGQQRHGHYFLPVHSAPAAEEEDASIPTTTILLAHSLSDGTSPSSLMSSLDNNDKYSEATTAVDSCHDLNGAAKIPSLPPLPPLDKGAFQQQQQQGPNSIRHHPCDKSNEESNEGSNKHTDSRPHVTIRLDAVEQELFRVLRETVQAYHAGQLSLPPPQGDDDNWNNNNQQQQQLLSDKPPPSSSSPSLLSSSSSTFPILELRVAGGWVRDKLLQLDTHDVDIAVHGMSGVQAATLVQAYVVMQHQQQQQAEVTNNDNHHHHHVSPDCSRKIGVIAANPAQSKHLETATMKVCGIEMDFCHLRSQESYDDSSRIPVVRAGTPREDALRRDFTMNALYYNLQTSSVEDWTGRGITDLFAGILVTPLDPVQTFRDDPLRILRAIRFAVRYDFRLDLALQDAAMRPDIHRSLHVKVSRERVGKELESMISGKGANPVQALMLLAQFKLAGSVFSLPRAGVDGVAAVSGRIEGVGYVGHHDSDTARHVRELGWEESKRLLELLPSVVSTHAATMTAANATIGNKNATRRTTTMVDQRLLPLAVYLLPFRHLTYKLERKSNNKQLIVIADIFRNGIKFKNKDIQAMTVLMECLPTMQHLLQIFATYRQQQQQQGPSATTSAVTRPPIEISIRLEAGLVLNVAKELWVTLLLLATVLHVREQEKTLEQQQQQQSDQMQHVASAHQESTIGSNTCTTRSVTDWMAVSMTLYEQILNFGLDQCWKVRPLLDGKALIQALAVPAGPDVKPYIDEQVRWMFLNPTGSRDECQAHLLSFKRRREQGGQQRQQHEDVGNNNDSNRANTLADIPMRIMQEVNDDDDDDDQNAMHLGMSDGTGQTPSSPITSRACQHTRAPPQEGASLSDHNHDSPVATPTTTAAAAVSYNDNGVSNIVASHQHHFSKKMHIEKMEL